MAQTSYGTITITDTTDIESIVVEYAQNQDPLTAPINGWGTTRPEWAEGYYIWQRTRTHKYGTSSSADDIGVAVCITGSQGETGRSLSSTTTQYTTAASSATITTDNMGDYIWYTNIPPYNSSTPIYWVRVTNIYSNPFDVYGGEVADGSGSSNSSSSSSQNNSENNITTVYIIYKDEGLTSAVSMSQTALTQSSSNINTIIRLWYRSNSATAPNKPTSHITQSSNNVDNTWTTTKPIDKDGYRYYYYCDELCTGGGVYKWTDVVLDTSNLSQYEIGALTTKVKNFWWDADGAHAASGKGGNEADKDIISTYGYNSLMGLNGISFGYDNAKVVELNSNTPALNFYSPPTVTNNTITAVGKKIMQLSGTSLTFYNPSNENETHAQLSPTGLLLREGGIQSGSVNAGNNGFIYLSTKDYGTALTIGDGINKTNWRQIIGTKFGVDSEGNLYGTSVDVTGVIKADSGYIGGVSGWTIASQQIYSTNNTIGTDNSMFLATKNLSGTINDVTLQGDINPGWRLTVGSNFGVDNTGKLYAANANINGKIIVTSGSNLSAGLTEYSTTAEVGQAIVDTAYTKEEIDEITISTSDSISSVNENINEVNQSVSTQAMELTSLREDVIDTASDLSNLSTTVNEYLGENGYIKIGGSSLELGKGRFKTIITENRLSFYEDTIEVAHISGQELVIANANLNNEMRMGNFVWEVKTDGRLILNYSEVQ